MTAWTKDLSSFCFGIDAVDIGVISLSQLGLSSFSTVSLHRSPGRCNHPIDFYCQPGCHLHLRPFFMASSQAVVSSPGSLAPGAGWSYFVGNLCDPKTRDCIPVCLGSIHGCGHDWLVSWSFCGMSGDHRLLWGFPIRRLLFSCLLIMPCY